MNHHFPSSLLMLREFPMLPISYAHRCPQHILKIQGWGVECAVIRNFLFVSCGIEAGEFFQNCVLLLKRNSVWDLKKEKKKPYLLEFGGKLLGSWWSCLFSVWWNWQNWRLWKTVFIKTTLFELKMVYKELGAMKESPYMEVSSDMLISTMSSSDLKLFLDVLTLHFIILKSRPSSLLQESCKKSWDSSFLPQTMCNESLFNNITATIFILCITLFSVCYLAKTDHEVEEKSLAETHKRWDEQV